MARHTTAYALFALLSCAPAAAAQPRQGAHATFEQTIRDLGSPDAGMRLRAAQLLKDAAYPEAAVPLAGTIADADDEVQVEAIAAELNIFLAKKTTSRRRIGLIIERRQTIAAGASFDAGRAALGPLIVPVEVASALARATHDDNPDVALDALYAFGALAPEVCLSDREVVLRAAAPELASLLGAPRAEVRLATLRVVDRVYARRELDEPAPEPLGDAIIGSLNDRSPEMKLAAMQALGSMRYHRAAQALADLFRYFRRGPLAEGALEALARIGNAASAPLFTAQLAGGNAALEAIALEGLARVGDAGAAAAIRSALESEHNESVLLASTFASAALTQGPIDPIVEALSRPKVHDQAFAFFIELAPGRSRMFARGAQDPDPRLRADVADILGLAADPAALPMVEAMARDSDPLASRAAERAGRAAPRAVDVTS